MGQKRICPSRLRKRTSRALSMKRLWQARKGLTVECIPKPRKNDEGKTNIVQTFESSLIPDISGEEIGSLDIKVEIVPESVTPIIYEDKIVSLQYFTNSIIDMQYTHSKVCINGKLEIIGDRESQFKLISIITLQCNICGITYECPTKNIGGCDDNKFNVN